MGSSPKYIFPRQTVLIAPLTQVVQHASGGGQGTWLDFFSSAPGPFLCPFTLGPSQTNKVESDLECLLCLMPLHRASLTCLLQRQLAPSGNLCHPLSFGPESSCILSRVLCNQRAAVGNLVWGAGHQKCPCLTRRSLLWCDTKLLPTLQISAAKITSEGRQGPRGRATVGGRFPLSLLEVEGYLYHPNTLPGSRSVPLFLLQTFELTHVLSAAGAQAQSHPPAHTHTHTH